MNRVLDFLTKLIRNNSILAELFVVVVILSVLFLIGHTPRTDSALVIFVGIMYWLKTRLTRDDLDKGGR